MADSVFKPSCYVLLNHKLTDNQVSELQRDYGVARIVYPENELSAAWAQFPAVSELRAEQLEPFTKWLSQAVQGDLFVVQGEMGYTFLMVDYALSRGLVPLHSVTKRIAKETREGEKVFRSYIFEHACFRKYKTYDEVRGVSDGDSCAPSS